MTPGLRIEPCAKRIRVVLAGEVVVDTTRAQLVWVDRPYPAYYLPVADIRIELLEAKAPGAVHRHAEMPDHVSLTWAAMDHWFEEDEEVYVHARSPYTRIDVLASSRSVRVDVDGVTVAESHHPTLLFETGLPTRYYFPKTDVRLDLLVATDKVTACPYKGPRHRSTTRATRTSSGTRAGSTR